MQKKILVAIDGSTYSSNSLNYLSHLFHDQEEICFHLLNLISGALLPAGHELLDEADLLNTIRPEVQKKLSAAKKYAKKASEQLKRSGIDAERITTSARISRMSIAADIIHEAHHGLYDALVIGRRGLSKIEELIIGSVSSTVLEKCHDIPIWIIDGQIQSQKILVPVDCTPHTLQAVDHLAFILQGNRNVEITLFHSNAILTNKQEVEEHHFHALWEPEWCREHIKPEDVFNAPRQLLLESGFPPEQLHQFETNIGIYPSRQIVRQSIIDDFGTIVMGRRPEDVHKGLFGSTSGKVIGMMENAATWIVG